MLLLFVAIVGFLSGILVNLLADYLPAKRHYDLARTNPFVSADVIPPKPRLIPSQPIYLWSGFVATVLKAPVFKPETRLRHVITEIGLSAAFVWITNQYANDYQMPHVPLLLFYAAVFTLITIIDMEHRWVLFDTIWPPALVAIAEAILLPRVSIYESLRGGLYGFVILTGLYILGIIFAYVMTFITGRRVGRTVLGFGDVRIATLCGLILGWKALGPALLLMILSGAFAAAVFIAYKVIRTRRYRIFSAIPYGPYIAFGTAIMLYAPWLMGDLMALILQRRYGM